MPFNPWAPQARALRINPRASYSQSPPALKGVSGPSNGGVGLGWVWARKERGRGTILSCCGALDFGPDQPGCPFRCCLKLLCGPQSDLVRLSKPGRWLIVNWIMGTNLIENLIKIKIEIKIALIYVICIYEQWKNAEITISHSTNGMQIVLDTDTNCALLSCFFLFFLCDLPFQN